MWASARRELLPFLQHVAARKSTRRGNVFKGSDARGARVIRARAEMMPYLRIARRFLWKRGRAGYVEGLRAELGALALAVSSPLSEGPCCFPRLVTRQVGDISQVIHKHLSSNWK
jgi:hypothetical protein